MSDFSDPLQLREDDRVRVCEDVVCTELPDDEAVLLHVKSRRIFRLNGTGLFVWKMLVSGKPLGEITGEVQQTYQIPDSQASEDVSDLVTDLIAEGIVALDHGDATNPPAGADDE